MKVGEIELRVPQERSSPFSTPVFEHYRRSEKALVVTPVGDVCAWGFDASGESANGESMRS